jgi:hypothetical protein
MGCHVSIAANTTSFTFSIQNELNEGTATGYALSDHNLVVEDAAQHDSRFKVDEGQSSVKPMAVDSTRRSQKPGLVDLKASTSEPDSVLTSMTSRLATSGPVDLPRNGKISTFFQKNRIDENLKDETGSMISTESSILSVISEIDNSKQVEKLRVQLARMSARVEEHPICKSLPTRPCIKFVESNVLDELTAPWPRSQELTASYRDQTCTRPSCQDLVIAVSHMWYYEKHPDPFGEKAQICKQLIQEAETSSRSLGRTLMFFDFLSLTQPPFRDGQIPRSRRQNESFQSALKAMPMIYLYADRIILLDSQAVRHDRSHGQFGRASTTPASERGWIYLERFVAMIKVAMTPEAEDGQIHQPVIYSNNGCLLEEILEGGLKLRDAAKAGKRALKDALQVHLEELQRKTFSAISVDKNTNQGGIGGAANFSVKMSDGEVVLGIMNVMVEKLFQHWGSFADGKVFSYKALVWEKARMAVVCRRFKLRSTDIPIKQADDNIAAEEIDAGIPASNCNLKQFCSALV